MNLGHTIQMRHILSDETPKRGLNPRGFGGWFLVPSGAFDCTGAGEPDQFTSREKEQFGNSKDL